MTYTVCVCVFFIIITIFFFVTSFPRGVVGGGVCCLTLAIFRPGPPRVRPQYRRRHPDLSRRPLQQYHTVLCRERVKGHARRVRIFTIISRNRIFVRVRRFLCRILDIFNLTLHFITAAPSSGRISDSGPTASVSPRRGALVFQTSRRGPRVEFSGCRGPAFRRRPVCPGGGTDLQRGPVGVT